MGRFLLRHFGKTGIYTIFKKMLRLIDSSHHLLEKEVWARVGSGDQDAYGRLYVFYYRRLYNYGRKMTAEVRNHLTRNVRYRIFKALDF
jgi:hypothetical protein